MKLAILCALLLATPAAAEKPHVRVFSSMSGFHGRLGAEISDMTEDLRKYFGAPANVGVLVTHVESDLPAAKAGLRAGDVITEINGKKVDEPSDIIEAVADKDAGAQVKLTIVRDKKNVSLTATLDKRRDDPFNVKPNIKIEGFEGGMNLPHEVFAWSNGDFEKLRKQMEAIEKRLEKLESQKK
jgi:C-terminal processing protease CtpA/Prc